MRIILRPEEAPGVRDGRLRETWAWLSIQVNDTTCLTEGMLQSGLRAEGVYGSYLPLLEWLLENWWSLLHEGAPSAVPFARSFFPSDAAWVRRHNLVAAREGFALPDCSIFADEDVIRLQWHPEPAQEGQRIRFIGSGEARIGREPFTAALRGFIEAALGRLRDALEGGRLVDTPDLRQLFAAWHAIREAKGAEAAFCRVMGALGVDPYDPDAIPESLAGVVEGVIRDFADPLRDALVAGSGPETLAGNARWVQARMRTYDHLDGKGAGGTHPARRAFEAGYECARRLRAEWVRSQDPLLDLEGFFRHWVGGLETEVIEAEQVNVQGFLGQGGNRLVLALPQALPAPARRFVTARAAYGLATQLPGGPPGLVTEAATWTQRAGRAFAAEFLAPAQALTERTRGLPVHETQVEALAGEFQVSPAVIRHQLQNFRIAPITL